jgi:DNA-binding NtrC family response regulator
MAQRFLRVLALDSNRPFLDLLKLQLANLPEFRVEATTCSEIERATSELAANPYDVLLVAERIGDVAGAEVLCDLRRAGTTTPAIVITASDDAASTESAMRSGAAECVAKSTLTKSRLAAALGWACERRRGALPSRPRDLESLCRNLSGAVSPMIEAARASLACVLAEGSLSAEQREQLDEARALCDQALGQLEQLLHEARTL